MVVTVNDLSETSTRKCSIMFEDLHSTGLVNPIPSYLSLHIPPVSSKQFLVSAETPFLLSELLLLFNVSCTRSAGYSL